MSDLHRRIAGRCPRSGRPSAGPWLMPAHQHILRWLTAPAAGVTWPPNVHASCRSGGSSRTTATPASPAPVLCRRGARTRVPIRRRWASNRAATVYRVIRGHIADGRVAKPVRSFAGVRDLGRNRSSGKDPTSSPHDTPTLPVTAVTPAPSKKTYWTPVGKREDIRRWLVRRSWWVIKGIGGTAW